MLNFLSRIDRYMASNMREHGRYLLELQPIDDKVRPSETRSAAARSSQQEALARQRASR